MKISQLETLEVVRIAGDKGRGITPGLNFVIKAAGKLSIGQTQGGYIVRIQGAPEATFIPMTNVKWAHVVEDEAQQQGAKSGKAA